MKFKTKKELVKALSQTNEFCFSGNGRRVTTFSAYHLPLDVIQNVVDHLYEIKTFEQFYAEIEKRGVLAYSVGLCSNFLTVFGEYELRLIRAIFELWDGFSGRYSYPVHTHKELSASEQYDNAYAEGSMYDGEYGQARFELFRHTVECLELLCEE